MPEALAEPPSICIVMPVFNGMAYLPTAVASLTAQRDPFWHLLAIDDAGTDGSGPWLEKAAAADQRIRVKRQRANRGLYGTLADAVDEIDADWIGILMQDDRLKPDYLTEMRALMARHPDAEALWAGEDIIDAAGVVLVRGMDTAREEPIPPGVVAWRTTLVRGCMWTISGALTRRSLLSAVPLRDDLPHCGDFEWFLRAVRSRPFVYYERPLAELRRHEGQASTKNLRSGQDLREALRVVNEQLQAHPGDLSPEEVMRLAIGRLAGVLRRVATSAAHARIGEAWRLARHAWTCVALPWRAAVARRRAATPGVTPERS